MKRKKVVVIPTRPTKPPSILAAKFINRYKGQNPANSH